MATAPKVAKFVQALAAFRPDDPETAPRERVIRANLAAWAETVPVTVCVVLPLVAYRVLPVVKYLASHHVPAYAPVMLMTARPQVLIALPDRLDIEGLKRYMQESGAGCAEKRNAMVIGRLRASIKSEKAQRRPAVIDRLYVGCNDSEVAHVPTRRSIKIRRLQDDMS